jgi:hypothetical protein
LVLERLKLLHALTSGETSRALVSVFGQITVLFITHQEKAWHKIRVTSSVNSKRSSESISTGNAFYA